MPQKQEFRVRMERELVEWLDGQAESLELSRNAFFNEAVEQFRCVSDLQRRARIWTRVAVVVVVLAAGSIVASAIYGLGLVKVAGDPVTHTVQKPVGQTPRLADNPLLDPAIRRYAINLQANLERNEELWRSDPAALGQEVEDRLREVKGHTDGKLEQDKLEDDL